MKKISVIGRWAEQFMRGSMIVGIAALASGCYFADSVHDFARDGTVPWWCEGTPDLISTECNTLSLQFDAALFLTEPYPTLGDVPGATAISNTPDGIGHAVALPGAPATFVPNKPNVLLYAGSASDSRLAGVAWRIVGSEPVGFPGGRDVWTEGAGGEWWLSAWIVRGYQNHPNVFAAAHPCLADGVVRIPSTSDACFLASHTEAFEILVTNDDGYAAEGINALVEGLYGLANVTVHVVAPGANQSGSGEQVTQPGYVVSASQVVTIGNRPATAIYSTDPARPLGSGSPADSVLYALNTMRLTPEVVLSGINQGQNMGPVVAASGTVGAARTARRNWTPAIATSQGGIVPPNDFPSGVAATLALLEHWRLGLTVNTTSSVLNINIPTCSSGSIRGTLQTVVAPNMLGRSYVEQNCASETTTINDDVDAFNHGYIGITDLGVDTPPNW